MIDSAICSNSIQTLERFAEAFDAQFSSFLQNTKDVPPALAEAMRYSALAPGKRLRPFLVCECCRLAADAPGAAMPWAMPAAMAIECVHAFSLIHDDLPAMDDASLRRGRPTCHVQFGEAMAILAGDALLALAFEILAARVDDAGRAVALVRELATATGRAGMISGQVADMQGESVPSDLGLVESIHERKTGRLITAACRMGVIAAGARLEQMRELSDFGRHLGRAFQIADDLLDVTASPERAGKAVGRDRAAGKQTYPAVVGVEESRTAARDAADQAIAALRRFGKEAASLRALATFVVERVF